MTTVGEEFAQASIDLRVWSLLAGEARRRSLTRVFGVPADQQSLLVTVALLGAGAAVLRSLVPPFPLHPSGSDVAIGGSLVNATLRGVAGAPAQTMPLAGLLIAFAVAGHATRPAIERIVGDVQSALRATHAAFIGRYR